MFVWVSGARSDIRFGRLREVSTLHFATEHQIHLAVDIQCHWYNDSVDIVDIVADARKCSTLSIWLLSLYYTNEQHK